MDFADVTTICSDYTINGLVNMAALANKPFRFIYTSGVMIERDQDKSLPFLSDYRHMRVGIFLPPYPLLGALALSSTLLEGCHSQSYALGRLTGRV